VEEKYVRFVCAGQGDFYFETFGTLEMKGGEFALHGAAHCPLFLKKQNTLAISRAKCVTF
jgi:hypothetical protein